LNKYALPNFNIYILQQISHWGAYSDPILPVIPKQIGHPFQFNSATYSEGSQPGLSG